MEPNRIFVGIRVPLELAEQMQDSLPDGAFLRRVEPENYHITILFLGYVEDLRTVREKFEEMRFKSFTVRISGIDGFYKKDKPKIVYLTVQSEHIVALHELTKRTLGSPADEQFPNFTPHVTLCRNIKTNEVEHATQVLNYRFAMPFSFSVYDLYLLNSRSGRYLKVSRVSLD